VRGCRLGTTGGTRKVEPDKYKTRGVALDGSADGSLNGGTKEPTGSGRWPPNLMLTHHEDCVEVGSHEVNSGIAVKRHGVNNHGALDAMSGLGSYAPGTPDAGYGRETVATFDCHPDCPIRLLDKQAGDRPSTLTGRADPSATHENPGDNGGTSSFGAGNGRVYADRGGPSRFMYTSKVSPGEREFGCDRLPIRSASDCVGRERDSPGIRNGMAGAGRTGGYRNHHKTLKPISVTRWLATLLLPPPRRDGQPRRILIPYCGAGSEIIGAIRAGWDEVVGIQRAADDDERAYIEIAKARIARWSDVPDAMDEAEAVRKAAEYGVDTIGQAALFGRFRP
jgi:hypothetical protein